MNSGFRPCSTMHTRWSRADHAEDRYGQASLVDGVLTGIAIGRRQILRKITPQAIHRPLGELAAGVPNGRPQAYPVALWLAPKTLDLLRQVLPIHGRPGPLLDRLWADRCVEASEDALTGSWKCRYYRVYRSTHSNEIERPCACPHAEERSSNRPAKPVDSPDAALPTTS
jgi:hypothetical protein